MSVTMASVVAASVKARALSKLQKRNVPLSESTVTLLH